MTVTNFGMLFAHVFCTGEPTAHAPSDEGRQQSDSLHRACIAMVIAALSFQIQVIHQQRADFHRTMHQAEALQVARSCKATAAKADTGQSSAAATQATAMLSACCAVSAM